MKKGEGYELRTTNNTETIEFRFTSVGEKGEIKKIIKFTYLGENLWNLAFGDVKGDDWEDNVISNNNDFRLVLQTITNAVHNFFEIYSDHNVQIVPLDHQRKLLYNRVFQQRWHEIQVLFEVKAIFVKDEIIEEENYTPIKIFDAFVISQRI
jgi:hypothetical protein